MITPIGTALWAHLDEIPKNDFNSDKYEISLVLDETDAALLRGQLEAIVGPALDKYAAAKGKDRADVESKRYTYGRPHKDKDGQEDGKVQFQFKTKFQPTLIDAARTPIPVSTKIGNGSRIRIKLNPGPTWGPMSGKYGVAFYPDIVQIIELRGGAGDTSEFDDVEGGFEFTPGAGEFEATDAPATAGTGDY